MKKQIVIFAISILSINCFSQSLQEMDDNKSFYQRVYPSNDCKMVSSYVEQDVKNGTIVLFCSDGTVPATAAESKKRLKFQDKYGVKYSNYGCVVPPSYPCDKSYNEQVFNYLTEKFGARWMKKVKKHAIGFHEWKAEFDRNQ